MTQLIYTLFFIGFMVIVGVAYKVGYEQGREDINGSFKRESRKHNEIMDKLYNQESRCTDNMPKGPISEEEKVRLRNKYKIEENMK